MKLKHIEEIAESACTSAKYKYSNGELTKPPEVASASIHRTLSYLFRFRPEDHRSGKFTFEDGKITEHRYHGTLHNSEGPAYISPQMELWCLLGIPHRTDGPAVTLMLDDSKFFFLGGEMYSPGMFFIMFYKNEYCTKGCHFLNGD